MQLKKVKTKKASYYLLLLLTMLISSTLFFGCESFIETDQPVTEIKEEDVFEDPLTAIAAITNVYAQILDAGILTGQPSGASKMMGLYSDELSFWGPSSDDGDLFFKNTLVPSTSLVREWWNAAYTQIYAANSVLEGVQNSAKLDNDFKNQLIGEAKFARALVHFQLVQLYGGIPYLKTTDYTQNSKVKRLSESEVMQNIINDLEDATFLLSDGYLSSRRVRPNSFAVKALLARVYLYNGDWAEAANSSSAVLNASQLYIWESPISDTFLKESPCTIWQLSPRTATRNTDEASTFIFTEGPPPEVALTASLMNAFESGDLRKELWTKAVTDGTTTWHHANKYKKQSNSSPQVEYSIVMRLAEQYLIRAEARAEQGDFIGAIEDLNSVRNKAGLTPALVQSKTEILTAILQERRVELFTEHGHRFFDLKRKDKLDEVLSGSKPSWNTTDRLIPLPLEELLLNNNLKPQNPGY